MSVPIPAPGMVFGERYRLVRQIAVGGMGEVWVAQDMSLSRDVAIKVLKAEYAGNKDFLARLRTEARNAASLSNSGIAQLYDYGERDGVGYLVMELIIGEPMSDLLERSPVLPLDRVLDILAQAARALHSAHVAGVVHRDVKPGNILLQRNGEVKITDFGVSLAADQAPMTATGMVMGTAQYLSPEQAVGKPATPSSDIYALGVIAFEALVGHRPFTGKTAVDIAVAHVNEPIPPLPSSVPPDVAQLVTRMLAKDPSERPRSGAQLALMLDEIASRYRQNPWLGSVGAPSGPRRPPGATTPALSPRSPQTTDRAAVAGARSGQPPLRSSQPTPRTSQPTPRSSQPAPRPNQPAQRIPSAAATRRDASDTRPADRSRVPSAGAHRAAPASSQRAQRIATGYSGSAVRRATPPTRNGHQPSRPNPNPPRRTSTSTGQRLGRWSWQAIVLGLLVFAVLIAWLVGAFSSDSQAAVVALSGVYGGHIRVAHANMVAHKQEYVSVVQPESQPLTETGADSAHCPDAL